MRALLREGRPLVGGLVRMPAEELVEMLAVAGHDFVLIDCEHGPADVGALRQHIALADAHGMPVLVRPGEREPTFVQRALDQGAAGIVAPHIDDAAAAEELVQWCRYPPHGRRGFATYTRTGRFGEVSPEQHELAAQDTLVIAMIESPDGVDAAQAVLGVPGIDGYLVGTGDLSQTLRAAGGDHPGLEQCLESVHTEGVASDSLRCDIVSTVEQAELAARQGAHLVVYNVASVLMGTLRDIRAVPGTR